MLYKIKEKINILFKKKDMKKEKHKYMHLKLTEKLTILEGKKDDESLEEILIIKKTIEKIEKELKK